MSVKLHVGSDFTEKINEYNSHVVLSILHSNSLSSPYSNSLK